VDGPGGSLGPDHQHLLLTVVEQQLPAAQPVRAGSEDRPEAAAVPEGDTHGQPLVPERRDGRPLTAHRRVNQQQHAAGTQVRARLRANAIEEHASVGAGFPRARQSSPRQLT
jgi:hypothetical protein